MRRQLYEGQGTILFEGPVPGTMIRQFTQTTSVGGEVTSAEGYAALRNRISELLSSRFHDIDIPTQFVRRLNMREQLIHQVELFPVRWVVRNYASSEFADRLGLSVGMKLPRPLVEMYYQLSRSSEPTLVSEELVTAFGWLSPSDFDTVMAMSLRAHDFLSGQFLAVGLRLVDLSLEFGVLMGHEAMLDNQVVVACDLSPSSWTLFDLQTHKMVVLSNAPEQNADAFHNIAEIARRLGILQQGGPIDLRWAADQPDAAVHEGAMVHSLIGVD